jgi:hypothetical protein
MKAEISSQSPAKISGAIYIRTDLGWDRSLRANFLVFLRERVYHRYLISGHCFSPPACGIGYIFLIRIPVIEFLHISPARYDRPYFAPRVRWNIL